MIQWWRCLRCTSSLFSPHTGFRLRRVARSGGKEDDSRAGSVPSIAFCSIVAAGHTLLFLVSVFSLSLCKRITPPALFFFCLLSSLCSSLSPSSCTQTRRNTITQISYFAFSSTIASFSLLRVMSLPSLMVILLIRSWRRTAGRMNWRGTFPCLGREEGPDRRWSHPG